MAKYTFTGVNIKKNEGVYEIGCFIDYPLYLY